MENKSKKLKLSLDYLEKLKNGQIEKFINNYKKDKLSSVQIEKTQPSITKPLSNLEETVITEINLNNNSNNTYLEDTPLSSIFPFLKNKNYTDKNNINKKPKKKIDAIKLIICKENIYNIFQTHQNPDFFNKNVHKKLFNQILNENFYTKKEINYVNIIKADKQKRIKKFQDKKTLNKIIFKEKNKEITKKNNFADLKNDLNSKITFELTATQELKKNTAFENSLIHVETLCNKTDPNHKNSFYSLLKNELGARKNGINKESNKEMENFIKNNNKADNNNSIISCDSINSDNIKDISSDFSQF